MAKKYTAVTGKKPYMLRHYFCDSQFAIPTREIWDTVYRPLGFGKDYEELRSLMVEQLGYEPAAVYQIGAAVAANSGPRVVGAAFTRKKEG